MKRALRTAVISTGLLFSSVPVISTGLLLSSASPAMAEHHYRTQYEYNRHRRHMKTFKRVGVGTVGGAVVGGLIGGGAGAGVGALAGGGTGYLYDRHEKRHGHY